MGNPQAPFLLYLTIHTAADPKGLTCFGNGAAGDYLRRLFLFPKDGRNTNEEVNIMSGEIMEYIQKEVYGVWFLIGAALV
ncbi:MAG: hypothetical protein J5574_03035, partial [Lachnospiraceae bacterium]|nr:hypothetical protein [Lachnospiraceae bacterium]